MAEAIAIVCSMPRLILFNKPFGVLSQFTGENGQATLADFIKQQGFYPAGRLDKDSEGLLLLTNDGKMQQRISDPKFNIGKTYLVQVDGTISDEALKNLETGVALKDGVSKPAAARKLSAPVWLWQRNPNIRYRKSIPTSWLELTIHEGRNRQVRHMTAAVGFPTLRLIRIAVGEWALNDLAPGNYLELEV